MFIKRIKISGFRSYYETNEMSDLSSGHNVIIGSNGCGKTNILNAIQFVLSDEFNGLDGKQRQQLINESHSTRLLTAFVEVVIDNTDRRIPLDTSEIVFRRQIGLKKDQYFMNNKIITHSDVVNMLETAGFSRSNPYYIVKQGKVNEMAVSSDEYRLQVMREVAGTRIYDQRKKEALILLAESEQRSLKITDCLQTITERVANLENESKDLQTFLKWDKRRRLLEYLIATKELENSKNEILKLEIKQKAENEVLDAKRMKLQEIREKSRVCEKQMKVVSNAMKDNRKDMEDINNSIDEYDERKAKIETKISDFEEKVKDNNRCEVETKNELKGVKKTIDEKRKKLDSINAKYEELKKRENQLNYNLKAKQSRRLELYSKQKRKESFRTVEERDRWIRSELPKLEKQIKEYENRIQDYKREEMAIINERIQLESEQNGLVGVEDNLMKSFQNESKELSELTKEVKQKEAKRSELWDKENELKEQELKISEEKMKIERTLTKLSGTSAVIGRQSVRQVLQIFKQKADNSRSDESRLKPIIDGYFGQLIDCFSFDPNLRKAIEVTSKSKLFYHIVSDDKIGTKILKEVNERKMSGDITFIAINKLNLKHIQYPTLGSDARPLTSLLKFDKKYEKVMKYLFDRTLVCRNLEVALKLARSRLDCVTIDGDFVSHKGLMSGGYYGSETRTETFLNWKEMDLKIEEIRQKLKEYSKLKDRNEEQLALKSDELSKKDINHNKTKHKIDNQMSTKNNIRRHLADLNAKYESIIRSIASIEAILPSIRTSRDSFDSELKLSLSSQLNEEEEKEMSDIQRDTEKITAKIAELCKRRKELGLQKSVIESELDKNLEKRKNKLEFSLIESKIAENETNLETEALDCQLIDQRIKGLRKQLEEKNSKINDLVKQLNEQKDLQENLRLAEEKQLDIINNEAKNSRKIALKIESYGKKNAESLQKLRNFGTIPSDSDTNYEKRSLSDQYKELHKCNRKVRIFKDINPKAMDQLLNGQEKGKVLSAEKRDIDLGYHSIENLIESLEHQKYEAIQLTYKLVSKHFVHIFKRLVPEGQAFIDMVYSDGTNGSVGSSQSTHSQESQSSGAISGTGLAPALKGIDNFVGVKIRVAFTGKTVIKEMNQLSGGQKSIVALAFIFAIQRCDPAPFYLFDEVDHALDPIYRRALADLIKEMSKTSQFITTTFRPELLERADKYFGVKFRNRISHIEEVSGEVAKDFITSDDREDQTRNKRKRKTVSFSEQLAQRADNTTVVE